MVTISMRDAVAPYVTRDGSEIRELMHPGVQGNVTQSLAEATVAPGATTHLHRHYRSEELYHITQGNGVMVLGDERIAIHPGDTVLIPPGTAHCVENTGTEPLVILCACSPPYAHEDTELITTN
jgi:mannose-6-phosphate isomerase-like protein (cupin superfamily)